jgi:hypothetical protein
MTDLDTMIRDCLQEHAQMAPGIEPLTGVQVRSRKVARRQWLVLASATAAVLVVTAGITLGIARSTPTHAGGHGHAVIVVQASPTPTFESPTCPSGEAPNLAVDKGTPPQPVSSLVPQSDSFAFVIGQDPAFFVNGQAPADNTLWILARDAGGDITRFIVSDPNTPLSDQGSSGDGSTDNVEGVNGWLATFAGCQAQGS